ncbi:MAG: GTP 3',8-cyclase MoaA [Clostridia bacterium]|nr:GTP 3',8-cyclase MoaA [Clostridia bacterium]
MRDRFGREIEYLRISITHNCNLKCIYCAPGGDHCADSCSNTLSPADFERVVRSMAKVGIRKVRITGGEPLVRTDVCEIIERISHIEGIQDISMTTNGIRLDKMAVQLKAAGLKRLNISLDSLKEDRFRYITGGGRLQSTLKGIEKSLSLGLQPIKINTVLMKGVNEDEIDAFIQLAKESPLDVRFIELMPIGKYGEENSDKIVYNSDIISARPQLVFVNESFQGQPARYYKAEGFKGRIGFISPVSHQFCSCCNRIRLTCDGKLKPCLGNNGEVDLMDILKSDSDELDAFIRQAIFEKPASHNFGSSFSSVRNMSRIGG